MNVQVRIDRGRYTLELGKFGDQMVELGSHRVLPERFALAADITSAYASVNLRFRMSALFVDDSNRPATILEMDAHWLSGQRIRPEIVRYEGSWFGFGGIQGWSPATSLTFKFEDVDGEVNLGITGSHVFARRLRLRLDGVDMVSCLRVGIPKTVTSIVPMDLFTLGSPFPFPSMASGTINFISPLVRGRALRDVRFRVQSSSGDSQDITLSSIARHVVSDIKQT